MNYPTLYLMLDQSVSLPSADHIGALCDNQRVGIFNNGNDCDGSFERFSADYHGIIKEVYPFNGFAWTQNVIAIETTQLPILLKLKYSENIKAMYWVKDPKTSVVIQSRTSEAMKFSWLVHDLADTLSSSVMEFTAQMKLDEDVDVFSENPHEVLDHLLSPVWSQLRTRVEAELLYNQDSCS